jgi:predicted transcriptional regulator
MTYQFPVLTTSTIEKRLDEGLGFRFILPDGVLPPEGIRLDVFKKCSMRSIPRIEARVILTDKEAQFGLPFADGRVDYSAFISRSEKFRQWSRDLFEHYWGTGKNLLP